MAWSIENLYSQAKRVPHPVHDKPLKLHVDTITLMQLTGILVAAHQSKPGTSIEVSLAYGYTTMDHIGVVIVQEES